MDNDHSGGKANNATTMPIPVNDHRAELNQAQYDWPKETRENPDGCPLIAIAGGIRGFVDRIIYLIEKLLLWVPEALEKLSAFLNERLGSKWWVGTDLELFAPK